MEKLTDDYVDYETAKMLCDMGFPQNVDNHSVFYLTRKIKFANNYDSGEVEFDEGTPVNLQEFMVNGIHNVDEVTTDDFVFCPNLYTTQKWLISEHNMSVEAYRTACGWLYNLVNLPYGTDIYNAQYDGDDEDSGQFTTKEKAIKHGISHALYQIRCSIFTTNENTTNIKKKH